MMKPLSRHLRLLLMRVFICEARYSLHINCGGAETTVAKTTYQKDDERGGAAKFIPRRAEWGFSSSGEFWFSQLPSDYIAKGNSAIRLKDSNLYMRARLSATSLTYYASCLGKGNYTVTLHFCEIVFANNSYSSLGRRIFDIYIQVTARKPLSKFIKLVMILNQFHLLIIHNVLVAGQACSQEF